MVSHPLPRDFYVGGGLQALRHRFADQAQATVESPEPASAGSERDYFTFEPSSPTIRAPSLPAITPRFGMTPSTSSRDLPQHGILRSTEASVPDEDHISARRKPDNNTTSPSASLRNRFTRHVSALRKQVAAGDLATDELSAPNEAQTSLTQSVFPKADSGRNTSTSNAPPHPLGGTLLLGSEDEFDLREQVTGCIAKSIGLLSPPTISDILARSSLAPSVSVLSTPNSPMFPPNGRSQSKSPHGNVLDLMNTSTQNENLLGGMIREAVARMDDDASSVSMSVYDTQADDGSLPANSVHSSLKDIRDHLAILHFAQGRKLVTAGEPSPGIFYVIDGLLEVSVA